MKDPYPEAAGEQSNEQSDRQIRTLTRTLIGIQIRTDWDAVHKSGEKNNVHYYRLLEVKDLWPEATWALMNI
jgi:hypothetical protein